MSRFKEYLEIAQNKLTIKTFEYDQHHIQLAIVDEKESEIIWEGNPFHRGDEALYNQELRSVQHRLDKIQKGEYVEEAAPAGGSTISTANFVAPNHVGTIRKLKRKKGGKFEYEHASGGPQMTMKNPDGSYATQKKIKGVNEVRDYTPDGIFVGAGQPGADKVIESIKEGMGMMKREIPGIYRGKK